MEWVIAVYKLHRLQSHTKCICSNIIYNKNKLYLHLSLTSSLILSLCDFFVLRKLDDDDDGSKKRSREKISGEGAKTKMFAMMKTKKLSYLNLCVCVCVRPS